MTALTTSSNKKTILLFLLRLLRAVISIATLILSAKFFGVSTERDSWLLAFNCIVVINLALWGPINETFRAKFIFLREQYGAEKSVQQATSLLIFTAIISTLIITAILIKPSIATSIISPTKSEVEIRTLTLLLCLLSPSLLLNQISLLLSSILNAYHIFYIPEIAGFFSSILNILALILLVPYFGIYSLVISYYLGSMLLIVLLIYQIRKNSIQLFKFPIKFKFKYVKPYILYSLPFFFPYFFGQLNAIAEKSIASILGDGVVSTIDYSRKFIDVPSGVLISVLTTILVPVLSQNFSKNNLTQFKSEFINIFHLGLFVLGTLLTFFTICSLDIVNLIYGDKKISLDSLTTISNLSIAYALSAIAIYYYSIIGLTLLSTNKGKVYAICGVCAQILMLISNFLLYEKFGVYVFPASLFLAHLISAIIMTVNLDFLSKSIFKSLAIYTPYILFIVIIGYLSNLYLFQNLMFSPMILILIKGFFLSTLSVIFLFAFKMNERHLLIQGFQQMQSLKDKFLSK